MSCARRRRRGGGRRRRSTAALAVALAGFVGLGSATTRAAMPQPPSEEPSEADLQRARVLFDNGRGLYDEGSYDGAIVAFERAYELSGDPNLLYNISLAYDRLERFEEAIEYLARYRAIAPESERAKLERKHRSLVARLDKQREASEAAERAEPKEPAPPQPEPTAPPPVDEGPDRTRVFGPAAWALSATAVVGLGIGTGFGIASLRRTRAAEDRCTDSTGMTLCESSTQSDVERARTFGIVADVGFAIGIAATVAAVTVVAVAASKRKRRRVSVAPAFGSATSGVTVHARF